MNYGSLVFGMIGGGISGLVVQLIMFWINSCFNRKQKQRVASMAVASGLRGWMTESSKMVCDMSKFWDSGGMDGEVYRSVAKFPFTDNVEMVASLESKIAVIILDLIHCVSDVNGEIDFEGEFGVGSPDDEDLDIALLASARIADLYLRADKIYTKLAARVGWRDQPNASKITAFMEERVKKYKASKEKTDRLQSEIW